MAILCCCSQLRNRKQHAEQEPADDRISEELELAHGQRPTQRWPTRPRPAKLPPPTSCRLGLSSQSTPARSSLTNPLPGTAVDASIQPAELVIEDSEDDNALEALRSRRNISTSTLDAVKARIRRHLSQDSIPRQGETEEQIAHRAQVKRLMRKRIQEELQSETGDVVSRSSTPQIPAQAPTTYAGNGPRDTIEFTMDEVLEQEHEELTRGKTLSMEDGRRRLSKTLSKPSALISSGKENRQPRRRSDSLCDGIGNKLMDSQAGDHRPRLRQGVSLPDIPTSPVLHPTCVPSLHEASSFTSWRLSLNVDNLTDLLTPDHDLSAVRATISLAGSCSTVDELEQRRISHMRSRPSPLIGNNAARAHTSQVSLSLGHRWRLPASHSLIRDESPVCLWLRTQDPQFRSSTTSRPQSDFGHEIGYDDAPNGSWTNASVQSCPTQAQQGKAPPNTDSTHPPSSKAQVDALPSTTCVPTLISESDSVEEIPQCVIELDSTTRDVVSGLSLARPLTPCSQRSTGTVQNSEIPRTATRGRDFDQKSHGGLRLPSFKWYRSASGKIHDENDYDPRLTSPAHSSPHTSLSAAQRAKTEGDSETSSVIHREAEFRAVEQRSGNSHCRHKPSTPTESKFRELFHDGPKSLPRNSFLIKLKASVTQETAGTIENYKGNFPGNFLSAHLGGNKFLTQRDGSDGPSDDCHLKVPSTGHGPYGSKGKPRSLIKGPRLSTKRGNSLHPRGFSSSKDGDNTAAMWKRAIRAESVTRSHRSSTSPRQVAILHHPTPESASVHGRFSQDLRPSEDGRVSRSNSIFHSPSCHDLPTQADEEEFRQLLIRSNIILEEWAHQLQQQERGLGATSHAKSSAHHPHATPWTLPPASWSKFPSHDREERNAGAGNTDNVIPKDFAVRAVSVTGDISWVTDKCATGERSHRGIVRSLSDRFTNSFRFRWAKIIHGQPKTPHKDKSMRGERRSSIQTSGILEYPELELLPTAGGYSELRALGKEINEMKGLSGVKTRAPSSELVTTRTGNRRSLTEKTAGRVFQADGGSDADMSRTSDTGTCVESRASAVRIFSPDTPATGIVRLDPTFTEYSSGSSRERYLTPCTHLSSCQSVKSGPVTPHTLEGGTIYTSEADRADLRVPDTATGVDMFVAQPEDCKGQDNADNGGRSAPTLVNQTLH